MQADSVAHSASCRLRPIYDRDLETIFELSIADENLLRWRYRGHVPTFEVFRQTLFADVLVQFVVTFDGGDDRPVGLAACYGADMRNRHAFVGVVVHPDFVGARVGATGTCTSSQSFEIDGSSLEGTHRGCSTCDYGPPHNVEAPIFGPPLRDSKSGPWPAVA